MLSFPQSNPAYCVYSPGFFFFLKATRSIKLNPAVHNRDFCEEKFKLSANHITLRCTKVFKSSFSNNRFRLVYCALYIFPKTTWWKRNCPNAATLPQHHLELLELHRIVLKSWKRGHSSKTTIPVFITSLSERDSPVEDTQKKDQARINCGKRTFENLRTSQCNVSCW